MCNEYINKVQHIWKLLLLIGYMQVWTLLKYKKNVNSYTKNTVADLNYVVVVMNHIIEVSKFCCCQYVSSFDGFKSCCCRSESSCWGSKQNVANLSYVVIANMCHVVADLNHVVADPNQNIADLNHVIANLYHVISVMNHVVAVLNHVVADLYHVIAVVNHVVSDLNHVVADLNHLVENLNHHFLDLIF